MKWWLYQRLPYYGPDTGGGSGGGGGGGQGGGQQQDGGGGSGGQGGGQQQQQQDGGGGGGGQQQQQQQAHWSAAFNLPAELAGHEFVKGSKDAADFIGQSVNAQKLIGAKGAIVPTDWNDKAAVEKFYEQLGVPKDHTAYKIPDRPDKQAYTDHDKAFIGKMTPVFREAGMTQRQVDIVTGAYNAAGIELEGTFKKFHDDSSAALDKKWGAAADANKAAGLKFAQHVFGDNYENARRLQLVGGGHVLDHPLIVEALSVAGQARGEDGWGGGGGNETDPFATPEAGQKYVDDLYAAAQVDKKHWLNHPETDEHRRNKVHLNKVQRFIASKKPAGG